MTRLLWPITVMVMVSCTILPATTALGDDDRGLDDRPRLSVRGDAVLHKPADQMRLRIAVVTEAQEAQAAVTENNRRTAAVVTAIEKVGLDKTEYQTGRFSIRPRHSRRPRQAAPDWMPQIIGYEVTNSLAIRTKKLDLAGKLIEAANNAGANSIDAISFDLADHRLHRAEAIATAAVNARADAAILARASEVRLVRILSIQLDDARPPAPDPRMMRAEASIAGVASAPPIQPGDVPVQASVTIVYEIAPRE
jgi:uncharacterized protein YggE